MELRVELKAGQAVWTLYNVRWSWLRRELEVLTMSAWRVQRGLPSEMLLDDEWVILKQDTFAHGALRWIIVVALPFK